MQEGPMAAKGNRSKKSVKNRARGKQAALKRRRVRQNKALKRAR